MNFLPLLLIPAGFILVLGVTASFYLTKRQPRSAFQSPAQYGLEFQEVHFHATDGLQLHGCWIPCSGSEQAVIILHGHGGCLDWDIHRVPFLHKAGFNVFLFDFRAHGRSQGHLATFGYLERYDVQGAVKYLVSQGIKSVGLLGFSYGAIASMLATPLCPEVRAVVADGGPSRLRVALVARAMEYKFPRWFAGPMAWLTVTITSFRLGENLFHYEPVRWVGKISPRPIFFINGELDMYCPDFEELFTAAGEPKGAWRLRGVGHTKASEVYPDEFQRRVTEFFERNL
jgi:pimeloyl-ACP methyl ester carboxylesterase